MATTANDLIGYTVEAIDGKVGHVDPATAEIDPDHLVVDIEGLTHRKVVVPLGVAVVDPDRETVQVERVKDWVKQSPKLKDYHPHDAGWTEGV